MPKTAFDGVIHYLRTVFPDPAAKDLTDGELLQRFLTQKQETAFALLVQRHGPMVLGVCRRLLCDSHSAEDALQATFVVLVRRAASLRRTGSLTNWLHGVARRIALKARAQTTLRNNRQRPLEDVAGPEHLDEINRRELRTVVDEEIGRLPDKYRAPIVLCYFEDKSYDRAAQELGWSPSTLAKRLTKARELLRRQLVRRGLTLSAGVLASALCQKATAAPLGAKLTINIVKAALSAAASNPVASGCISAGALVMAEEIITATFAIKVKAVVMFLALGLAIGGLGWASYRGLEGKAETVWAEKVDVPEDKEKEGGPKKKDRVIATDRHGDPLPEGAVSRLGTVRFNHGDRLNFLFFLPDGKKLVSEGNGKIRIWDAANGKELRQLDAMIASFNEQVALSADGKFLTILNIENEGDTVRIWDLVHEKEVSVVTLPIKRRGWDAWHRNALTPDGSLCAINNGKQIHVFDIATAKELFKLPNKELEEGLAITFAGNDFLVTADKKQLIQVLEAKTGKLVRKFNHGSPVEVLVASANGKRLATLEHHNRAIDRLLDKDQFHVWDLTTGTKLHTLGIEPKSWYMDVRFSADGKILFSSRNGENWRTKNVIWDTVTGTTIREVNEMDYGMAVSPDGTRLAVGYSKFNLVDFKTGLHEAFSDSWHAWAKEVFLSPEGDRAFTISYISINEWDVASGKLKHSAEMPNIEGSLPHDGHSLDGRYAATFQGDFLDPKIVMWDTATRKTLRTLHLPRTNSYSFVKIAFSPNSKYFATVQHNKGAVVTIWDIAKGIEVVTFKDSKTKWPASPYFSADGKALILAGPDVVGYDIATGKELFSWRMKPETNIRDEKNYANVDIKPPDPNWNAVAISPDGTKTAGILERDGVLGSSTKNRIVICDAKSGTVLRRIDDFGNITGDYDRLTFSPDSRLLATPDGQIIHLWEVTTGRELDTFRGHRGNVRSLSFSANGRRLASSSSDGTCLIWDLPKAVGASATLDHALAEKEIARWWADLAGEDSRKGYHAIWRLAESSKISVSFLAERVSPVTDAQIKKVFQHITDLDSDTYSVRQKAFKELDFIGRSIEPALRQALGQNPQLEKRLRLEKLLTNITNGPTSGEPLRMLRALAVLEYAGTPEAQGVLQTLAQGAPGAWLTEEAKKISERIALRAKN